jgi:signal transduction histidine kinase
MDALSQEITIITVATLFFLVVAGGFIVLFLVYQKRQLRYILEKKELSNQFQKELLKTRLEAQEETFNNLSAELHDNIGQLLSSSKFLVGVADRELQAPSATLKVVDETMSKAIFELRAISKSFNTGWLEQFSLIENLKAEVDRMMASKEVVVTLEYPAEITIATDRQMILFRIVQEALQNAMRHGKPSSIAIKAESKKESMYISIMDNGKGFDVSDAAKHGVGIINIRHRAQLLGGEATWKSSAQGTTVTIQLPMYAS